MIGPLGRAASQLADDPAREEMAPRLRLATLPDGQARAPILSREKEAQLFREMNYLKYLACRIRDRIDPDSPAPDGLDEFEQFRAEAVELKNRIVETHLRLVVAVAKKFGGITPLFLR